jgi:hypothetical protein
MTALVRAAGAFVAIGASLAIVEGSHVAVSRDSGTEGVLRLAWRARPDRVEECRPQSEDLLARLPAHMRQAQICEGESAAYRLEVRVDRQVVLDEELRGAGLRHDRPIYVFREVRIAPGDRLVAVSFVRLADTAHEQPGGVPPTLTLERAIHVAPGRVVLISYDPEKRTLYGRMATNGVGMNFSF